MDGFARSSVFVLFICLFDHLNAFVLLSSSRPRVQILWFFITFSKPFRGQK